MGKGSTGAAAGGGAIYGLGVFGALVLLPAAGRRVQGVRLGDLPERDSLASFLVTRGSKRSAHDRNVIRTVISSFA